MKKLKDIFRSKFVKNVFTLQAGSGLALMLDGLGVFLVAKILKPANFGIYCLIFSIYSLITIIGNLGLKSLSIMKISDAYGRGDAKKILEILSFFIKFSLALGIIVIAFGWTVSAPLTGLLYGNRDIGNLARPLYLIAILSIVYSVGIITFHGLAKMRELIILENLSALIVLLFVIPILLLGGGIIGAVWAQVGAAIVYSLLAVKIYLQVCKREDKLPSPGLLFKNIKKAKIKPYLKPGLPFALSGNIDGLYEFLPVIIIGIFLSSAEVGYFKFGYSIISVLVFLFFQPISRNLKAKFPLIKGQGNFRALGNLFYKTSFYSGIISILVAVFTLMTIHIGIKLFAKEFTPSLKIIYMLLIYLGASGFFVGLSPLLLSIDKVWTEVKFKILGLAVLLISCFVLVGRMGLCGAAIAIVFAYLITKISLYIFTIRLLRQLRA